MNILPILGMMVTQFAPHTAKYFQLSQRLQQQIASGTLSPNQQLPTEDGLMQAFGVSRGTVRKAIDLLANQGLVRREQGRGTFVNDPSVAQMAGFELGDFAQEMRRQQRSPSTRVLKFENVTASAEIASLLHLDTDAPVIHIQRLRLADKRPIIFEERFLSSALCPDLIHDNIATQSIHWLLVHKYELPLVRVTHSIEMRDVGPSAALLDLEPTDPIFAVERLTFTKRDDAVIPAVLYRALCHGAEYQFKAQFNTMI